jgi:pimeloyl-ACP methyl ester carboxylesterase
MRKRIRLKRRRSLIASYSFAKTTTSNWIVFVPESAADFKRGERGDLNWLLGAKLAAHFNILALNKPGLGLRSTDEKKFEASFRRKTRVADALTTMRKIIPTRDSIFLIGYSEGAYLAPSIARRDRRVKTLTIIGGGTRGWLKEELSTAMKREKPMVRKKIREILKQPRSTEKWHSFSFATWFSYRGDETLQDLRRLKIPILAILGARDHKIDLKAALQDLRRLKKRKNIRIRLIQTCGHSFGGHWPHVRKALGEFL